MCVSYPPGSTSWNQMHNVTLSRIASNAFTHYSQGTKQELRRCVEDRFCFRFRESSNTHVSPSPSLSRPELPHRRLVRPCPPTPTCASSPACSTTSRSPMCSSSARPRCRASTSDLWTTERTRCSSSRISACWATSTTCSRRASPSMSRILGENGVSK